ncbi:MAG: Crp/Fnr family transcriptional regulator [Rhizobacter sp.]|nr:Crp/Fnr family transcriptional regulator [Ferruginibacter sp.]
MCTALQQQIEHIIPLNPAEFNFFLSHFTEKKLKKGEFLIREGNKVQADFFIVKGCLKAYHIDNKGTEHILQFAVEDWWITDFQAYLLKTPATINIVCLEDCEVLSLSFNDREKLCAQSHTIEHFFRKKSNFGFVALQKRILSLLTSDAKERHTQFLNAYPQLYQRLSKKVIAAYLGVSRETLSRLRRKKL